MKIRFFTLLTALLLNSMAGAQALDTNSLTNGLILYYPLNGNINDYSGNGNDGVNNTAAFTSGRFGNLNSSIHITESTGFNSKKNIGIISNNPRTVSVWIYVNNNPFWPNGHIIQWGGAGGNYTYFNIWYKPYQVYNIQWDNGVFSWGGESTPRDFVGSWNHIVLTFSETSLNFYLNGKLVSNNLFSEYLNLVDTSDSQVGFGNSLSYGAKDRSLNFNLSDVRIYNRALSSNEVAALYAMESTPPVPPTTTDTFGSGTNQFGIDFVTVGNPGNTNDTTGYGGVPYSYRIGKYTISQNQIDAATRNGLQNVTAGAWSGDQPAANISWYEAAAYVNWLNTSQGYRPAYNLTFTNGAWSMALWPTSTDTNGNVAWTLGGTNLFRNALCHYFLPSENEWYKAAYYDPNKNGGSGGYWLYPTGSDTAPTAVSSGTAVGTAVYNEQLIPASVFQAGGLSPYGTMGQGGNVWQWEESAVDGTNNDPIKVRIIRAGGWLNGANALQSVNRNIWNGNQGPNVFDEGSGFRVASVDDSWLTNGLVAYYPFRGDFKDYSGNDNDGLSDGATFGTNRFGISSNALSIKNYQSVISKKNLGVSGNSARTISIWLKSVVTRFDDSACLVIWGANGPSLIQSLSSYITSGNVASITADGGHNFYAIEAPSNYSEEVWHQLIYTYADNLSNVDIYIDGLRQQKNQKYVNISGSSSLNTTDSQLFINGQVSENRYGLDGLISDVRIYNRALSSNEVAQLYALESTPPPVLPPPTIATQPFDQEISLGQNTSFTINATGTGPFSYQWMKDGVALTNQTNASLVINNAQSNAVGYYSCAVTDANSNSVTSSNAALNISGVPFWLWQGLVGYYPFDGNANDKSGFGNDGNPSSIMFSANRFGRLGAADFSKNGKVVCPKIGGNNHYPITMSVWYKLESFNNDQSIMTLLGQECSGYTGQAALTITSGFRPSAGHIVYLTSLGYDNQDNIDSKITPELQKWHQIIFTYDQSLMTTFYQDGNKTSSENYTNSFSSSLPFVIGSSATLDDRRVSWQGLIGDVRIYNRALSSNEVASLYALESTPPGPTNSQSISFPTIPTLTLTNGAYTLGAMASSGLPVSYAIGDTNLATLTNGTLIPVGVGTTTIVASQVGDTNYLPATPVTNTLVVTLAQQTVTPTAIATRTYGSLPFGLTLPTNASGLPITARIVSGPATLSGTNLILTGTGTVTLAYDIPGNDLYAAASVTNSFAVTNGPTNLKSQAITFKALAAKTYGSAPLPLAATVKSGLPVSYWSSNTNVAVINGTNAVITGAGQTVITAYQPGDGTTYNPATPVSQTLQVNQAAQKLTLKAPKSVAYGSTPVAISATSTAGLPVTLTSSDPSIAMITNSGTNSLLVPTGVGTITLTASQPGTANVINAPAVGQPVVITPGAQTITFAPLSATTYGASLISLSATSSAGLPVTFSSSAAGIASISGNTLTIAGAGSAKITASQAGSKLWAPAKAITQSLAVAKAPQTISLSIPSSVTFTNGGLLPLTGTSSSGLPVAYKSANAKVLFIQGTNCLISGRGTTTVVATQPGSANYLAAPAVTNTVTVQ